MVAVVEHFNASTGKFFQKVVRGLKKVKRQAKAKEQNLSLLYQRLGGKLT